ncbi:hypothetical protein HPG69_016754, partial [Diceros bicornis minor]
MTVWPPAGPSDGQACGTLSRRPALVAAAHGMASVGRSAFPSGPPYRQEVIPGATNHWTHGPARATLTRGCGTGTPPSSPCSFSWAPGTALLGCTCSLDPQLGSPCLPLPSREHLGKGVFPGTPRVVGGSSRPTPRPFPPGQPLAAPGQQSLGTALRTSCNRWILFCRGNTFISDSRNHFSRCQALLSKLTSVNPQMEIDGLRNIWIVKPAAKSRGRDIVCMNRVEEILELVAADHLPAKDNRWVVQKYIETPLLIYDTKFDIRQWFLVTDWNPLTIWFYKESYLRFSTQRFSLDNLDSAVHLCNNSIQKHLRNDKGRSPLLPGHNMWTCTRFQEYLRRRGRSAVWGSVVYPAMKRAVAHAMRVAQARVEPRRNSFELYGADFVLGRDYQPWLIEINSSPTMHASTPVTAQLCAQVQEDTIKVVVDRKTDRSCDTGNFELLLRQPKVELPLFHTSELCVKGISVRKARKQMPPISNLNCSSSLSDSQPLTGRCPSAMPDPVSGAPPTALQQDLRLRDEKVLPCTLPAPLKRPTERSYKVQSIHSESGGKIQFPSCHFQHVDNKAPKTGLTRAELIRCAPTAVRASEREDGGGHSVSATQTT